jgi:hypothetical protein
MNTEQTGQQKGAGERRSTDSAPIPNQEVFLEFLHHQTHDFMPVLGLKTDDPEQEDQMTREFVKLLAHRTDLPQVKPVWSLPEGQSWREINFKIVDKASHCVIFGKSTSEAITAYKRAVSPVNALVAWPVQTGRETAPGFVRLPVRLVVT